MKKHTFWTLCQYYDKIEIPIIQRDYAQGRNTKSASTIRFNFSQYLINALCSHNEVELDFIYGSTEEAEDDNKKANTVFIPLDGQQRLTTLYLLHWYIAAKEGRLDDARDILSKFTYETRPSAHDFCKNLITFEYCENIAETIKDCVWYNDSWHQDQTVDGMIRMLDTFEQNEQLNAHTEPLFDKLIDTNNLLISFHFVPLEEFGLTEQLYVRMNARGKMLSEFENFKSEFYKIISYSPKSSAKFKDCIEYKWVDNLWEYRGKDKEQRQLYTIDEPFMYYLAYITDILYHQDDTVKNKHNNQIKYNSDQQNNNFDIYRIVYSKQENLDFLIFAIDEIYYIKSLNHKILWDDKMNSVSQILRHILTGQSVDITPILVLYATIYYKYRVSEDNNILNYIRVIRNITENTDDKSRREWSKIIKSINELASNDVYSLLMQADANELMEGFHIPQRQEEILKAHIIKHVPDAKNIIHESEDNVDLEGNISCLLKASYSENAENISSTEISQLNSKEFNIRKFRDIYNSYKLVSEDDFNLIWGDLINSTVYTQEPWGRLNYHWDYRKHDATMQLVFNYYTMGYNTNMSITDFAILIEKEFVKNLVNEIPLLNEVNNVKHQLYLYYILTVRVMGWDRNDFFRWKYNFGWLAKEKNYTSIFTNGIKGDNYYEHSNPIFQTYNSQFRYNLGLNPENTPKIELVGTGRKNKPFEHLLEWAN